MHTTTLLTLVALAGIANADVAQHHHRRHHAHAHAPHHRDLVARQRPVMTDAWWETNPNAPSGSAASQESSAVTPTSSVAPTNSAAPTSSPPRSSAAPTSAAPTTSSPPAQSAAPTSAQASPSVASSEPSPSVAPPASSAPASASAPSPPAQSAESSPSAAPALSSPSSIDPISRASTPARLSTVTSVRTVNPSASPSGSALPAEQESSGGGGGLSKTAIIAIAVSASVVGAIAIGWTLFRKWKLRPSNRFDEKMKPIDFSPAGRMDDDFLEKTLHRSASNASADRQRQAFVAELDTPGAHANHVPGVPEHDFTAGYAGAGAGAGAGVGAGVGAGAYGAYQADPFAPGAAAGYDGYYQNDAHGYPPQQQGYDEYGRPYEYPTQDGEYAGAAGAGVGMATHAHSQGQDGYADLKRGNSNGSDGHQYAHAHAHAQQHQQHQQAYPAQHSSPADYDFPESGNYLGRPTGGADGPYAQAATYRY